jgi:hypothetical protein
MRMKLFTFSKPYFSMTWKIDPTEVEHQVSTWLNDNPHIHIESIHHTSVASFWYPTQLLIVIYYRQTKDL